MRSAAAMFAMVVLAFSCAVHKDYSSTVSQEEMSVVYQEIRTPYKHGLVVTPESPEYKSDSPSVFQYGGKWYMTWIVLDGKGYETWLSEIEDLLA